MILMIMVEEEEGKLYGLGTLDTKSTVAAMMSALQDVKDPQGLSLLFYCDEEYDFAGKGSLHVFRDVAPSTTGSDRISFCLPPV